MTLTFFDDWSADVYDELGRPWDGELVDPEHAEPSLVIAGDIIECFYVDGRPIARVVEFDRRNGWVRTADGDVLRGRVTVRWSDGKVPEVT